MGRSVFNDCGLLTSVTSLASTPPVCSGALFNANNYYVQATLHVLPASLAAYQSATYWKDFSQILGDVSTDLADVNGDGEISIADANNVIEVIVNGPGSGGHSRVPGDGETNMADVNSDGEINIADYNAVINAIIRRQ
jgi:hypothetical protein